MADLKISELGALAGANLAAGDLLPIVDVSASETKKITVTDLVGNATTLIADATIPSAKVLFGAGSILEASIATGAVTTTKIENDAVTAAKLADESSVDLVTTLPGSGAFVGQIAIDTDDGNLAYVWNGSSWVSFKAAGSVGAVIGSTAGVINIVVSTSGSDVTISATLDNTASAAQFLAGPTAAAGAVTYRTIASGDLPTAASGAQGAVSVNGEGLRVDGTQLEIDNDITASGGTYSVVTYSSKGLVTAGRAITAADLPAATSGTKGAVVPGTGLAVDGVGTINHSNTATAGTYTKVTIDGQGHVTTGATLSDTDIPNHSAALLTTGTLDAARIGNSAITGAKLANYAVSKFGETQPVADHIGQFFFNPLNRELYLWDGNVFQPVGISAGEIVLAGTYNANTNLVDSVTADGTAAGFVSGSALPAAATANNRYYVVVSTAGTGTSPAPTVSLAPPDLLLSNGSSYIKLDVSDTITAVVALNVGFTPYGNIAATNVQAAIQELDDEKLAKAGGTVTGQILIGTAGSLVFEGATDNASETTLAVADPTADRTITLPDQSGNVLVSGNASIVNADVSASAAIAYSKLSLGGSIVNADIASAAAIADTKLDTISTAGKVSNSATTATSSNTASAIVARDGSGNFTAGTVTAALSGNASTATALQTARNIQGVSFDGTANITVVTAGSGISVTGTAVANTGVLSVNGSTGAITNVAVTNTAQSFTAAQRGSVSALTSAATVTADFSVANNFSLTLGHNVTLANPTNLTAGQSGSIVITQGSGTAYTVAYGSNWKFSGGTPTMSTGLSSVSTLVYYVESASRITAQLLTNVS